MNKSNLIAVAVTVLLMIGAVRVTKGIKNTDTTKDNGTASAATNVKEIGGKQEVTITAAGGYSPRLTTAKANMPTTLKLQGKNAYGCESAVRIPQLSYVKNLEANGSDTIELPPQKPGSVINGTCGMGMYRFQVKFN